jgi:DNA-binding PadR family transcriptional regulator
MPAACPLLAAVAIVGAIALFEHYDRRDRAWAIKLRPIVLRELLGGPLYALDLCDRLKLDFGNWRAWAIYGVLSDLERDGHVTWEWHARQPQHESLMMNGRPRRRKSYSLTEDGRMLAWAAKARTP